MLYLLPGDRVAYDQELRLTHIWTLKTSVSVFDTKIDTKFWGDKV